MISIIIPLYNSEKYIYGCIQSIISNDYKDFEIIIVDDGSTDNSIDIVNKIKDDRIRVFKIKHGGPGSARNKGLSVANGEYIFFLDSDDTIPKKSLKSLIDNIEDSDIVIGNYEIFYDSGDVEQFITPNDCKFNSFFESVTVWNRLYKKQFLKTNNIKFQCISQGEDRLFLADLYLLQPKIKIINENVYNWQRHDNDSSSSLTHIKDSSNFDGQVSSMIEFKSKLYNRINYNEKELLLDHLRYSCIYLLEILDNSNKAECNLDNFNKFIDSLLFSNNKVLYKEIFNKDWREKNE